MFRHAAVVLVVALASGSAGARSDPASMGSSGRGLRHFEDVTGDLPNEPVTAVAIDPRDTEALYAGQDGFVFKSVDGGESWRPVLSFPRGTALEDADADLVDREARDQPATAPSRTKDDDDEPLPNGDEDGEPDDATEQENAVANGLDDGEQALPSGDFSEDLDTTAFSRVGPGARAIVFVPGSPEVLYVATPRGLYRSVDRGSTFARLELKGGVQANDVRDLAIDPARPSKLYLATAAGLLVSRDGGASFERYLGTGRAVPALCVAAEQLKATDGESGVAVLVGTEGGLLRSTDGGAIFLEVLLHGLPPFFPVASVAITKASETFFAGTSRGLYVGERNAALLERYSGVPETAVQAILADPVRARAVVVGTRARGVLFSPDAGNTVEQNAEQVPAAEVLALSRPSLAGKTDDLLVATDRGLFRSRPGTGVTISAGALKKLREMWSREPGLNETANVALVYNGFAHDNLYGMGTRARFAKLLPQLEASYDLAVGRIVRREDFLLRGGDELPPGVDPANDETDLFGNIGAFVIEPSEGLRHLFFVRLEWDLDAVIFNADELAVSRNLPPWYAAERRIIERVREAWSARRRLMTEIAIGEAPRGADAARTAAQRQLRLEELTAQLDGATGGAFSNPPQEDSR